MDLLGPNAQNPTKGSQFTRVRIPKDPKPNLRKDRPEPQTTRGTIPKRSQIDPKKIPNQTTRAWIPKRSQTTHVQGSQKDLTVFSFSAVEPKEHQHLLEIAEELSRLYFREHMTPSFTAMCFTWENGRHKHCSSRALYACLSSRAKPWQITFVTDPSF